MPQHGQVNLVSAFEEQRARLQRLLDRKIWISDTPGELTPEAKGARIAEIKSLIQQLDDLIQG